MIRSGRVALANALGTGVADDKAMYVYVPRMIEFYLGEHAILNNVQTYMLRDPKQCQHVLNNLQNLVVKEVQGSGGYGMLIGPASTAAEREAYKLRVMQNPDEFHRPADARAVHRADPGRQRNRAASRGSAALRSVRQRDEPDCRRTDARCAGKGSLVVNSSQGGGTKDTWVLERLHAEPHRRKSVLDGAQHGAGREHRAHARCELPHVAVAVHLDKQALHFEPILAIAPGSTAASTNCSAS